MHVNAVAYNADLDQLALSSPNFNEIWIIDHGTTTEEARGHTGGRWSKGGDLLYRWGNPRTYRQGTPLDQRLFFQHNIQWIPKGLCGEGHLLVFNNGSGRQPDEYSSVEELEPPTDKAGGYVRREHAPFGPDAALWSYTATNKSEFFSWFISGAQRLPSGNTLINSGAQGVVFEVTPDKEIVWKFVNPIKNMMGRPATGSGPPKLVEVFSRFERDQMGMKESQWQRLDEIDNELTAKLMKALTAEQQKILAEPSQFDMEDFFHTDTENIPNCGTAACIGGWAITLKLGVTPNEAQYRRTIGEPIWRLAADALDLPYTLAYRLFYTGEWPREFDEAYYAANSAEEKARVAVARIDHFIKTGK
jgi:hypothetical protein